jgi:pimeloyl-ACP methyl ester carboxylesterase
MRYDAFDVPVSGGELRVGRWGADDASAPVVVALHGVTANHRCWAEVAARSRCAFIAPDLRGRGRSNRLAGPAGMARHAEDVAAVLDHLALSAALVVGHSMGGFVAAAFAERCPDRVLAVTLVDGGLPLPPPPSGTTPEQALAATIGPAARRLTMTFPSSGDYLDYWRPHPALGPHWSTSVEDYLLYDLEGERSSVSVDAVREDSADLLDADAVARRARSLPPGTVFLRAPFGLMAEPGGLYPPELAAANAQAFPNVEVREVPGVNHYSILFAPEGAEAVASTLDTAALGSR